MIRWMSCRTCGRLVPAGEAVNRAFCSEECARTYSVCTNCGRFFLQGKGFDAEHCTRECTVQYHIMRKYGPQPVTVVTEV